MARVRPCNWCLARTGVRIIHLCPPWSLSVEDLLPWRRLYSATLAAPIRAWSPKCAVSSSAFATWKPSSCGSRKRTTHSPLASDTRRTCSFWTVSLRLPDDLRERGSARTRRGRDTAQENRRTNQGRLPGVPIRCLWVLCPKSRYADKRTSVIGQL